MYFGIWNFCLSCVMAMSMCLWGNHFWPNWPLDYSTIIVFVFSCFNINVCKYVYIVEINQSENTSESAVLKIPTKTVNVNTVSIFRVIHRRGKDIRLSSIRSGRGCDIDCSLLKLGFRGCGSIHCRQMVKNP